MMTEAGFAFEGEPDGRIRRLSPAAKLAIGAEAGAFVGRVISDMFHGDDRHLRSAMARATAIDTEVSLRIADTPRVRLRMDWTGSAWDGRVEPIRAGAEVAPAIDELDEGIVILDAAHRVVRANLRAIELLDALSDWLQPGRSLVRLETIPGLAPELARALASTLQAPPGAVHDAHISTGRRLALHKVPLGPHAQLIISDVTELRRAQNEKRERDRTYRQLFENAGEGFYLTSPRGHLRDANPALARILGYDSVERLIGDGAGAGLLGGLGAADAAARIQEGGDDALSGIERRLIRCDGVACDVLESVRTLRDEDGRVVGFQGMVLNISERKRAERELRESEATLKGIVDVAGLGVSITRPDGVLLSASQPYLRALGLRDGEVPIGEKLSARNTRYIHPEDRAIIQGQWERAAERREPVHSEVRFIRQDDGQVRTGRFTYNPVLNAEGDLDCMIGLMQDVTDSRLMEERLALRDRELALIIANIPGAIVKCVRDPGGLFRFPLVRGRLGELWKAQGTDRVGEVDLNRMVSPEEGGRLIDLLGVSGDLMSDVDSIVSYEQKEGGAGWLRLVARPQMGSDGTVTWIGVLVDITEQKQYEEKLRQHEQMLRQAQKMESIGRFAGGVAHDFNNLLQPILMMTEAVRARLPEGGDEREILGEVVDAVGDARDLVRQVLTFARQEESAEAGVNDLAEMVRARLGLVRALATHDIELQLGLNDEVYVRAEPGHVQQIVMNLATNAVDAMGGAGHLAIRVQAEQLVTTLRTVDRDLPAGPYGVITVRDTGPGIRPDMVARLFDPFFTSKGPQGTGLGLSVVHGLVASLGGGIRVFSPEGQGATFEVYLPLVSTGADAMRTTSRAA